MMFERSCGLMGPMRTAREDVEPTRMLSTGQRVLQAVHDSCVALLASGHMVTATADGEPITVAPTIHKDAWFVLDSNWHDTYAILEALAP